MPTPLPGGPIHVFCSYAHDDEALLRQLQTHLSPLKRQGLLALWHDRLVIPGTDWAETIDTHLNTASIILLLISPDFFASDYCFGKELTRALERHKANEVWVVPILLRPVAWQDTPFAHLQVLPTNGKPVTEWANRDAAFLEIVTGIRQGIEKLNLPSLITPSSNFPRIWNVPYLRNPFFTGREDLLSSLAHHLWTNQPMALSQPQAISGLGGVGKTQVAVECAYRYAHDYQAVLWTCADSREALVSGFVELASLLQLPERNESDHRKSVTAVKHWLQYHDRWLLILDNADDISLLPDFLPSVQPGQLLLTTRAQALGGLANRIEVNKMDQSSGMLLLLRRAGLLALEAPLEQAKEADLLGAQQIWQELDGLPLALDQVGAYIEETHCSPSDYLHLFRTKRSVLLKRRGGMLRDHPESVYTTFTLAVTAASQRHGAAVDLLRVCSLLYPDAIPEELFRQGASHLGSLLKITCMNELSWNELLATVCAYSLLQHQPKEQTLTIHRLVQAVLQESMPKSARIQWTYRIISAMEAVFPQSEYAMRSVCERLVLHALCCAVEAQSLKSASSKLASLLYKIATYLVDQMQHDHAELLYQRALHIWAQALGPHHPNIAYPLDGLASLYSEQGKYEQAESLYQQALHIREQALGPVHFDVATSLNNLAELYRVEGKNKLAKTLYQRALHIWRYPDPDTVSLLNNLSEKYKSLADLYEKQGNSKQAKSLSKQAEWYIRKQTMESTHPDVAYSLGGLANIYKDQKKYEQAEPLFRRALRILEQTLGPDHPTTANVLHDFAVSLDAQGNNQEAESLYQRALAIRE